MTNIGRWMGRSRRFARRTTLHGETVTASKMPAAEIDVTPELIRALIAAQYPAANTCDVALLANGWDNVLYRVGHDLVARLPRREDAVALVDHEATWLGVLAPRLPVPIPVPLFVGQPTDDYPWSWTIVPWFDGTTIGSDALANPERVARELGAFVAALHQPAPDRFPKNPYRGVPLAERAEITEARLAAFKAPTELKQRLHAAWRDALDAPPWCGEPVWLHGDLHPANIIVRDDALAAVIDFGDITAGDPATDLLVAWALFEPAHRATFRHAANSPTRDIDDAMWRRARGWAVVHGLAIVSASADNPTMHTIGMRTLHAAAE